MYLIYLSLDFFNLVCNLFNVIIVGEVQKHRVDITIFRLIFHDEVLE